MDPNPTPFPGKNLPTKSKPNRKPTEPSISRQNRVFGTVRNANIPTKTLAAEKPAIKPSKAKVFPRKQPEWNTTTRVPIPEPAKKKNSSENPKPQSKPIRVQDEKQEATETTPIAAVQVPAALATPSPSQAKAAVSSYQSAKICSKCRFDKLEMASYWLGQINLAESVGKHFVSAAFFRLAYESKAEPIKKLRLELKRYLARNGDIRGQTEWREVCVRYGMLEDERLATETESFGSVIGKLDTAQTTTEVVGLDRETGASYAAGQEQMKSSEIK